MNADISARIGQLAKKVAHIFLHKLTPVAFKESTKEHRVNNCLRNDGNLSA